MFAEALLQAPGTLPVPPFVSLGAERAGDVPAREALLDLAMGPGRRRKASEALRRGRLPAKDLAFVAKDVDGRLAGTVRLWNVCAGRDDRAALLLGPLAVAPTHEGQGIGGRLMRRAIAEAARLDHPAILLVGDPDYYARFGFCAAPASGLSMPGPFERHRLLGLELVAGALQGAAGLIRATGHVSDMSGPDTLSA